MIKDKTVRDLCGLRDNKKGTGFADVAAETMRMHREDFERQVRRAARPQITGSWYNKGVANTGTVTYTTATTSPWNW